MVRGNQFKMLFDRMEGLSNLEALGSDTFDWKSYKLNLANGRGSLLPQEDIHFKVKVKPSRRD